MFSDILLTADFDRTLTGPDSKIPQRNLDAVAFFMANGGTFTVNTGRSLPQSALLRQEVPMNAPFLCYNGSLAIDEKDQILFCQAIDLPLEETLQAVRKSGIPIEVNTAGKDKVI